MPVIDPPLWTDEELEVEREKAIAAFCTERLEETVKVEERGLLELATNAVKYGSLR